MMPAPSLRRRISATRQRGVSLLEFSVVLLIAAFAFGAILKGQELIFGARVRALLGEHESARAAWLGFQDRYRALPGDYDAADRNIRGVSKTGNGDGRVEAAATSVIGPNGVAAEAVLAWDHLSKSRFIAGEYNFSAQATTDVNALATAVPRNLYGGFADIAYDGAYGNPATTNPERHTLKTGQFIPVAILAEIDRKIDDGKPWSGGFQVSYFGWVAPTPVADPTSSLNCVVNPGLWRLTADAQPVNCGGSSLL